MNRIDTLFAYRETVAELTAAVPGEIYGETCVGTSYTYSTKYYEDPLFGITQALRVVGKVLELCQWQRQRAHNP